MKSIWSLLLPLILILLVFGCGEEMGRENPLDAQNVLTGGAPPFVTVCGGDCQAILTWPNLGIAGIKEYRIYRAYQSTAPDQFQYIASVPARDKSEVQEYTYIDTGLENGEGNIYFYRVSYVDNEGNETPDPVIPQSLSRDWFLVEVTPNVIPPAPDVQIVADTDLQVRLSWEGYAETAPPSVVGYRVYSAPKAEPGQEQQELTLVEEINDLDAEYYTDGNDYLNGVINFREDNVTKLYKVVAFDNVGIESDSPTQEGTSPNLPPSLPRGVQTEYTIIDMNIYEATITWERCPEPDVLGYVLYALTFDPYDPFSSEESEFKKIIKGRDQTEITISDRLIDFYVKSYYLTAFDSTPKPDGKRDESMRETPEPFSPDDPTIPGFLNPGDTPPDFTLPVLDGGEITLSALKGNVVLIDFFATWCGPCVAEAPHLQALYEEYKDMGLVVLAIDLREPEIVVRSFRDQHGLTFDILLDAFGSVAESYQVEFIPSVFLLDREGIITWINVGFSPGGEVEMEQQILSAL